jgi:MoxR-like ATPase
MNYKVEQYKNRISSADDDTRRRFTIIKNLSKDFTTDNKTARDLDELLAEQMELEDDTIQVKVKPETKVKSQTAVKRDSMSEIEKSFNELFDELKNRKSSGGNVSPSDLNKAIDQAIKKVTIGFDQLDPALQDKFSVKAQVIRYEIPDVKTKDFEKPPIKTFQSIVDDIMMGNNVMLVGGAGTGKTYLAEMLIAKLALGRDYIAINCSQWTAPTEIIGGQTMDGYVEGKLIEAWKNGYVLILDELPKIDPNTAGLFNDALAKTKVQGSIIFNSKRESFVKHKNFACIATGNIYPDKESIAYGANNKQDLSLLDRFSGSVYQIEKNPEIEMQIIQNEMIWSICDRLRSAIEELRYEAQVSLRFMQNARDTFNLEMQRLKEKGKSGLQASEGKTFKTAIDNYLSTFTDIQQKNLKEKIRYNEIFKGYEYRAFDRNKKVF